MKQMNSNDNENIVVITQNANSRIVSVKNSQKKESVYKIVDHHNCEHNLQCLHLKKESKFLSQINHPNVIKLGEYGYFKEKSDKSTKFQGFCALNLEKCESDLYNKLKNSYPNLISFDDLKKYFFEIASAMAFVQEQNNICHLDIKLENILIDDKNSAKIADFGLAQKIKNLNDYSKLTEIFKGRSKYYLPVEAQELCDLIDQKNENLALQKAKQMQWKKIDVFSFGTCIFMAVFLTPPFQGTECSLNDKQYSLLGEQNYKKFWSSNSQFLIMQKQFQKEQGVSAKEFCNLRDLLQNLIQPDPEQRQSFQQIINHEFFKK